MMNKLQNDTSAGCPLERQVTPLLLHGDCLDLMATIESESVDMILCDLPYGTTACKWDTVIPFDPLWANYKRVIRPGGAIVLFGSQPFTSALVMSNPKMFRYEIIWDKVKPSNFQMMNFQVGRVHENILVFSHRPAVFCRGKHMVYHPQKVVRATTKKVSKTFYGSRNSTLREGHTIKDLGARDYSDKHPTSIHTCSNADMAGKKLHPTQKPVALCEYLIRTYTNEGDMVLDNCMGSGTTGVACLNTGRNFIGIEKDLAYFEIARKRNLEINNHIWEKYHEGRKETT
jgi:site-specific DNA-methyltransferase (adenine-specific)